MVGLAVLAAPAGAQTNSSDYTSVCTSSSGTSLGAPGALAGVSHLSAHVATQTVDPNCPPSGVEAATQVQGEALARTGSDSSIPLARIGLVLVAAGGLVVLFARRRRHARAAATRL